MRACTGRSSLPALAASSGVQLASCPCFRSQCCGAGLHAQGCPDSFRPGGEVPGVPTAAFWYIDATEAAIALHRICQHRTENIDRVLPLRAIPGVGERFCDQFVFLARECAGDGGVGWRPGGVVGLIQRSKRSIEFIRGDTFPRPVSAAATGAQTPGNRSAGR